MDSSPSFDDLKRRLAAGDSSAPQEILDRFARRLVALARSRLNPRSARRLIPRTSYSPSGIASSIARRKGTWSCMIGIASGVFWPQSLSGSAAIELSTSAPTAAT